MPVYEYICTQCDETVEQRRRVDERDNERVHCGRGVLIRKQFVPPARVWAPTRNQ